MSTDAFDLSRLSGREREILHFAADGLTDIQIALRLDIRPSTVNSYWVRIRSKLGHRSRTELVAMALRKQAKEETAELRLRSQQWESLAADREKLSKGAQEAEFFRHAFQALPDPVAFVEQNGVVRFVNDRFAELLRYDAEELCGTRGASLLRAQDRRRVRELWSHLVANPMPMELGVDGSLQLMRKDRTTFPACLRLGMHLSNGRLVVACLVLPV